MTSKNTRRSTRMATGGKLVKFLSDKDVKRVITGINIEEQLFQGKTKGNTSSIKYTPKSGKLRTKQDKEDSEEEGDHDDNVYETSEKPRGLCDEDDVAGDEMYSFRTPKKSHGMLLKARDSASKNKTISGTPESKRKLSKTGTPLHELTPSKRQTHKQSAFQAKRFTPAKPTPKKASATPREIQEETSYVEPKTPYQLRARQKRAIQAYTRQLAACESDLEDSDYHGSEDSSSESEHSEGESVKDDSSSDSGKGSEQARPLCRRSIRFHQPPAMPTSRKRGKDINYVFTADEYFESRHSKCKTSDHNLSRLKTSRLDSSELRKLLRDCCVSATHQRILTKRRTADTNMFQWWMFALSQGYSVLAYGLGSKYQILHNFHQEMLADSHVVVINGFFPSLNIKEIVDTVARDLLGLTQVLPSAHAIIDWIESRRWMPRVFLIVHNLDAEMLRCEKAQRILCRLAALPRVHLVASVDHINCPLLWDQAKLSGFNFMWEDTTSFLPYKEETSYETSLMVQNSGSLALSSLLNVYRSLPHNSRGVFRIILNKHLDETSQKNTDIPFSELYGRCRQEMLVTSDLALRTMLTEFLDHQMVKWRRDNEHLYIPTDLSVLKNFYQLIQDS